MDQTTVSTHQAPPDQARSQRHWQILLLLGLAQFMVVLDVTVVNVALPSIGRTLALHRDELTWVVTGYTMALGSLLIFGGRLADVVGRKYTFLAGLVLFTAASVAAGLADSSAVLLTSRVAQGTGAALLSPAALSILTTEFTGQQRNRAFGVWTAIGGAGAAVGVMVGGALTSGLGWRWVFMINLPIGLIVGLMAPAIIPGRPRRRGVRIDILGVLTGTAAVAFVVYGVIRAGDTGWTSATVLASIGAAVVCGAGFLLVERKAVNPLAPPALLRRPPLPGAVGVTLFATGLLYGAFFLNSIYLQDYRHFSPVHVGLIFLPPAVAMVMGAAIAAHAIGHVGPRVLSAVGMVLAVAGLLLLALSGVDGGGLATFLPGFIMAALGTGATMLAATVSGLSGADEEHSGLASGILNTGHELGGSLGIAVASTIAASSISGATVTSVAGFRHALLAAGIVAAVLAVVSTVLMPREAPAGEGQRFIH